MKRHFYFLLVMLATGLVGCNITIKPDPNSVTTNVDSVEVSVNVNVYGDSVAAQPVDLSQCDMVMLDNGKLHFYDTKTATSFDSLCCRNRQCGELRLHPRRLPVLLRACRKGHCAETRQPDGN